jgi:hypothetical protein
MAGTAHRFFRLRGQIRAHDGAPPGSVGLAVVDIDPVLDDWLGFGAPAPDGSFELVFPAESFRQEPLESEAFPAELRVIVARRSGGELAIAHEATFRGLRFLGGAEDLGEIRIPATRAPGLVEEVFPFQDFKRNRRLHLDDELVGRTLDELAPVVEELTGSSGLRHLVELRPTFDLEADLLASQARPGAPPGPAADPWWLRTLRLATGRPFLPDKVAAYEPYRRVLFYDVQFFERQSLDLFALALGHELVHAAQFQAHPELLAGLEARFGANEALRRAVGGGRPLDEAEREALLDALAFTTNLEGYATHVEHGWLAKRYRFSGVVEYVPPLRMLTGLFALASRWLRLGGAVPAAASAVTGPTPPGPIEALLGLDGECLAKLPYALGAGFYRHLRRGDEPAIFDPARAHRLREHFRRDLVDLSMSGALTSEQLDGLLALAGEPPEPGAPAGEA